MNIINYVVAFAFVAGLVCVAFGALFAVGYGVYIVGSVFSTAYLWAVVALAVFALKFHGTIMDVKSALDDKVWKKW